jgi:hypothetical protein
MARYDHLPIYREAFDLALYFEKLVRGMGRSTSSVRRRAMRADAEPPWPLSGGLPRRHSPLYCRRRRALSGGASLGLAERRGFWDRL